MNNKDQILSEFLSSVRCDIDVARSILDGTNWNLVKAIDMMFSTKVIEHSAIPKKKEEKIAIIEPEKPKEKLVLFQSNKKFEEARKEANKSGSRGKCLLLTINSSNKDDIMMPSVKRESIFVHLVPRFHFLDLDKDESDAQWFIQAYKVPRVPCIALIDPETSECHMTICRSILSSKLYESLRQFLIKNESKYGLPLDMEIDRFCVNSLSSESDSDDIIDKKDHQEEKTIEDAVDPGKLINIMILLPNGKREKIQIGDNLRILSLYNQASIISGMTPNVFELSISVPLTKLVDMKKKISDFPLKGSQVLLTKK